MALPEIDVIVGEEKYHPTEGAVLNTPNSIIYNFREITRTGRFSASDYETWVKNEADLVLQRAKHQRMNPSFEAVDPAFGKVKDERYELKITRDTGALLDITLSRNIPYQNGNTQETALFSYIHSNIRSITAVTIDWTDWNHEPAQAKKETTSKLQLYFNDDEPVRYHMDKTEQESGVLADY
ncbi:MAG TPA: hypothetical protein VHE53_05845 [Patescibacteria group bacterium]|nr:hypothetical protein [Patescibacteria group bacterium]